MLTFDPTIRAGDISQIVVFIGVGIGAYYRVRAQIALVAAEQARTHALHEMRLAYIDATLENSRMDLRNAGVQDMQIAQLRKELDELKHWKGFVSPDGEYRRDSTPVKVISNER